MADLNPELTPELYDVARFVSAPSTRRWLVTQRVIQGLGPGFSMLVERERHVVWHAATRTRFVLVPGGTLRAGISEAEARRFDTPAFIDSFLGWCGGHRKVHGARLHALPSRVVTLAPFLIAERPTAALIERARIPSDADWEHAYRAGTTTPFPWGERLARGAWSHPLGLDDMGRQREQTIEGATRRVRGGGTLDARADWHLALSGMSTPLTVPAATRPLIALDAATPSAAELPEDHFSLPELAPRFASACATLSGEDCRMLREQLAGTGSGQAAAARERLLERGDARALALARALAAAPTHTEHGALRFMRTARPAPINWITAP